jgi:uncharacterized protein involved in exopolysaccharide biosynthesis
MSSTESQSEFVNYKANYSEDEIELIDILHAIWKWKYFIVGGTIVFAILAMVISVVLPKIYQIETLIQPGILSYGEDGKSIHIDTQDNIKALIEAGAFNFLILNQLAKSNENDIPDELNFKVTLLNGSNAIKINYETPQIEQGIMILDLLGNLLTEEYSNFVDYYHYELDRELNIARAEIEKTKSIKHSIEINISNIEKRINELQAEIVSINENTSYLKKERINLLSKKQNESNILSAILYSNTIQQNLELANDYENQINNLQFKKEAELQKISEQENIFQRQLEEIKSLEIKKSNIKNIKIIRKPYSTPDPIKPNKILIVILATFIGMFIMVFLSFFIEYITKNRKKISLET